MAIVQDQMPALVRMVMSRTQLTHIHVFLYVPLDVKMAGAVNLSLVNATKVS
jgi:hypothetical protein